ncbi:MAG TPA: MoxR family ATPase [Acidimicrobiales bacterium]|nr:MoxR family ATPase [Acidimicrobiales bacterium]
MNPKGSRESLARALEKVGYLVDEGLATALFLARAIGQPLLLEGEPGVGKTTAAKAMAAVLGGPLIRLQCYEGVSASEALYEWNYAHQLLAIRAGESSGGAMAATDLFTEDYLLDRPLLRAVRHRGPEPAVLLIDEIDRADDEFEALLFEFLGEKSVTVPELGTFRTELDPVVILTSNRSRELHDALKRRCLYHWIEFPSVERAARIVRCNVVGAADRLVGAATAFVAETRELDLDKSPGVAEIIDWVGALHALGVTALDRDETLATLGAVAKTPDDLIEIRRALDRGEIGAAFGGPAA